MKTKIVVCVMYEKTKKPAQTNKQVWAKIGDKAGEGIGEEEGEEPLVGEGGGRLRRRVPAVLVMDEERRL